MDIASLLHEYDRPVPRYTSYPTAVQFTHDIGQDYYAGLLAGLAADHPVSLYVHIPFCHVLCHYCGCHTKVANDYTPARAYVQTLLKEISLVGEVLSHRPPVSQVHFGGGSPNFLAPEDIERILTALAECFDFERKSEIAIEADPRLLNQGNIKALAGFGVTRMSLGVQDFNPAVQEAVNRIQPFDKVRGDVMDLRSAGIDKINFDLMVGLPLQTVESVRQSVEMAASLNPDRLAVFAYAHVPWMKKHQKLLEKYEAPDTRTRFEMAMCVKDGLENAGYRAIGIDHFAREEDSLFQTLKNKTLRRNFQGYTDDQAHTILSFGLSSISSFDTAYVQNVTDTPAYRRAVGNGEFPIMRGRILTPDDLSRRALIESLMCFFEADISGFEAEKESLARMQERGLIEMEGSVLKITPAGQVFARIVASHFDSYFSPQETQRHARAV